MRADSFVLDSALMTGVRTALERNLPPMAAVDMAVSYAQRIGAPDAIAALGAIARAKMQEVGGCEGSYKARVGCGESISVDRSIYAAIRVICHSSFERAGLSDSHLIHRPI